MAILISGLLTRVQTILQDTMGVRWDEPELLRWFNDGRREIALQRPTEFMQRVSMICAPGALQQVPQGIQVFARVSCNLSSTSPRVAGRTITYVDEHVLTAVNPRWQDPAVLSSAEVVHFTSDINEPDVFMVYPPNDGQGLIEVTGSVLPADATDTTQPIGVRDLFANALVDYILYRCYAKDTDTPANAERSGQHLQLFVSAVGIRGATEGAGQ